MTEKDDITITPFLIWITGLAGSGKSTLARAVFDDIKKENPNTVLLDGDEFRKVIDKRDAYSREDRLQIALQITRFCKLLIDQNINVICATISLFKEAHRANRQNIDRYFEIFIECDMEELIRRDKNEIYSKALKGQMQDVVGVDITFDKPVGCNLVIDNRELNNLEDKTLQILKLIKL